MKKKSIFILLVLGPVLCHAQDTAVSTGIGGLRSVLDQLYTSMLPLCGQLIGVAQAIGGLAALTYIGARVLRHISAAEEVVIYPLLRPFGIGIAITLFPYVIALMNGVLSPTVDGTAAMLTNANTSIATLLAQKQAALQNTPDYQVYNGPDADNSLWDVMTANAPLGTAGSLSAAFSFLLSKAYYNVKNTIKVWLSEVLQVLYEAAALCIDTVRTFQLLVLAILGPLVLALSIFDPFRHTLDAWLARYVNVYLWLPVANIFGAIIATVQTQMIGMDIRQIQTTGGTYFGETDIAYLVFLILGIVGYFTVPSTASYIVNAGGSSSLTQKISALAGAWVKRALSVIQSGKK
jgi:conjugative transposon TraJ protein